jgi:hypothetical protein
MANPKTHDWYTGGRENDVIVERTTSALPQTSTQNIFTVSGGQVLLRSLIGIVTVQVGAVANAIDLLHGTTTISGNVTDVNGDAVGTRYSITGTLADDVVKTAVTVPVATQATELVLPAGNVVFRCAGSDGGGGRIQWTAVYVPLNDGATLVAA